MTLVNMKKRHEMNHLETDVAYQKRLSLAEKLSTVLASTYVLYHKTQAVHWNVTGPMFVSVHNLTETQYEDLAEAVDNIAERIRALGAFVPIGLSLYAKNSIVIDNIDANNTMSALTQLADDHIAVANEMRGLVDVAEKVNDVYSADLLTARIGAHEEAAWMLRASVG